MLYHKHILIMVAVVLSVSADFSQISFGNNEKSAIKVRNVRKVDPIQASRDIVKNVDLVKIFKNLRRHRSSEEVRIVGTLGLLSGALKVEESMRENLYHLTDELLDSFNKSTPNENMKKLMMIEETINRDKSVLQVLNGMLKYARNVTTLEELQSEMQRIKKENDVTMKRLRSKKLAIDKEFDLSANRKSATTGKLMNDSRWYMKYAVKERLYDLRDMIDNHTEDVHSNVTENVKQTIKYIKNIQNHDKLLKSTGNRHKVKLDPSLNAIRRLWDEVGTPIHSEPDFNVLYNYRPDVAYIPLPQSMGYFDIARLTKGEEFDASTISPVKLILVDSKLKRFKREDKDNTAFSVDVDLGLNDYEIKSQRVKDENNEIEGSGDDEHKYEPQEFEDPESEADDEPGGLVGLITNLSGGADGSDVGAIVGALSQVVTNLLGPGGLDIPGLVATGSTLLASLIGGEENFGKVLGDILGLAVDGFSGGGGAENNGEFIGQFIGRFLSALSADADDDDAPIQPDLFIESVYNGILKGSAKQAEERGSDSNCCQDHGSDSGAFIKGVLSGLFNVLAKASAAGSAGLSQGSVKASGGFSTGSAQGSAQASGNKGH